MEKINKQIYITDDGKEFDNFRQADFHEQRSLGLTYKPRCIYCEGSGYEDEVIDSLANLKRRKDCPFCDGTGREKEKANISSL